MGTVVCFCLSADFGAVCVLCVLVHASRVFNDLSVECDCSAALTLCCVLYVCACIASF